MQRDERLVGVGRRYRAPKRTQTITSAPMSTSPTAIRGQMDLRRCRFCSVRLPRVLIDHALALLDSCEWITGPTEDGGYSLIGCRAAASDPAIFDGIAWGTPSVFSTTMSKIAEWESSVAVLPERWDIDVAEDWERYRALQTSA